MVVVCIPYSGDRWLVHLSRNVQVAPCLILPCQYAAIFFKDLECLLFTPYLSSCECLNWFRHSVPVKELVRHDHFRIIISKGWLTIKTNRPAPCSSHRFGQDEHSLRGDGTFSASLSTLLLYIRQGNIQKGCKALHRQESCESGWHAQRAGGFGQRHSQIPRELQRA